MTSQADQHSLTLGHMQFQFTFSGICNDPLHHSFDYMAKTSKSAYSRLINVYNMKSMLNYADSYRKSFKIHSSTLVCVNILLKNSDLKIVYEHFKTP